MLVNVPTAKTVTSSESVADICRDILAAECEVDRDKEHCWVFGMTNNLRIKYVELVTLGILDASRVHSREVFRTAITQAVHSIIFAHNHVGPESEPSSQDDSVTKMLTTSGDIIGIAVSDHVIVSAQSYYSYLEAGTL